MSKNGKTIVVLGGGAGGVVAVHELAKKLTKENKIVLIEKNPYHLNTNAFLGYGFGFYKKSDCLLSFDNFAKKRIIVKHEEVLHIDPVLKKIKTNLGEMLFDYALLALGADYDQDIDSRFKNYGINIGELEAMEQIKNKLNNFSGKNISLVVTGWPIKNQLMIYETVFLIDKYLRQRKIREKVILSLFTPEIMPYIVGGEKISRYILKQLEIRDIRCHLDHEIKSMSQNELSFNHGIYLTDLFLYTSKALAPIVIKNSHLAGIDGYAKVDPRTLQTNFEHIYAIGDCTDIKLPNGEYLPKSGVTASNQADIAVTNIIAEMFNLKTKELYTGFSIDYIEVTNRRTICFSSHYYHKPTPLVRIWNDNIISFYMKRWLVKYWKWRWFT